MKKMKSTLIGLSLLVPLSVTGVVIAKGQMNQAGDMFGRCANPASIMSELDLTDEQKVQLFDLKAEQRDERAEQREERKEQRKEQRENRADNKATDSAEMQAIRDELQQLMAADTFDKDAAQALIAKKEALRDAARETNREERELKRLEASHAMLSILTAEQKTKYMELQQAQLDECTSQKGNRGHGKNKV